MSSGTSARKVIDIIDSQSYEACRRDYKKRAKERKQLKTQEKRHRLYFLKQKVIGVFLLVLTIFAVKLLEGDATIALITVPLGLGLIFSKEKWWMDSYYFETQNVGKEKVMKQPKRLTYEQKCCLSAHYLNWKDWMLVEETEFYYKIVNKKTGAMKSVDKFTRRRR